MDAEHKPDLVSTSARILAAVFIAVICKAVLYLGLAVALESLIPILGLAAGIAGMLSGLGAGIVCSRIAHRRWPVLLLLLALVPFQVFMFSARSTDETQPANQSVRQTEQPTETAQEDKPRTGLAIRFVLADLSLLLGGFIVPPRRPKKSTPGSDDEHHTTAEHQEQKQEHDQQPEPTKPNVFVSIIRGTSGFVFGIIMMLVTFLIFFLPTLFIVGIDRLFEPGTYMLSATACACALAVFTIASVVGGSVCALIAGGRTAGYILAVVMLGTVLDIPAQYAKRSLYEGHERTEEFLDDPHMARIFLLKPYWFLATIPVLMPAAIVLGSNLTRSSGRQPKNQPKDQQNDQPTPEEHTPNAGPTPQTHPAETPAD